MSLSLNNSLKLNYNKGTNNPLICNVPLDSTNSSGMPIMQKGWQSSSDTTEAGVLKYTRNTKQYVKDHEGILRPVMENCAGIEGSRIVTNLQKYSTDISAWTSKGSGVTVDSLGDCIYRINFAADGIGIYTIPFAYNIGLGAKVVGSIELKSENGSGQVKIDDAGGSLAMASKIVTVTTEWQRFSTSVGIGAVTMNCSSLYLRKVSGGLTSVLARFPQLELVTSQSIQAPSEYIPTTNAPMTQCFNYKNPYTVDGNGVVTDTGVRTPIESEIVQNGVNGFTWSGTSLNWWDVQSHTNTGSNRIEQNANGVRFLSDGTNVYINKTNQLKIGLTYSYTVEIASASLTGNICFELDDNSTICTIGNSAGIFKGTFVAGKKTLVVKRAGAATDIVIKSISVKPVITGLLLEPYSTNKCTNYSIIPGDTLGNELLATADRTFTSDTGWWTKEVAGISINTTTTTVDFNSVTNSKALYRSGFLTVGKVYRVTYSVLNLTVGGFVVSLGATYGTPRSSNGTAYTEDILCTGNGSLQFRATTDGTTGSIDDISIREIILGTGTTANSLNPSTAIPNMTLSGYAQTTGSLVVGAKYKITAYGGSSNVFVSAGAANNTVGTIFTATSAQTLGTGSENSTELVTNGGFTSVLAPWSQGGTSPWAQSDGTLINTAAANIDQIYQNIGTTAGKMYTATYTLVSITGGGGVAIKIGNEGIGINRTSPRTYTETIKCVGAVASHVYFKTNNVNTRVVIDNVSVKEVINDSVENQSVSLSIVDDKTALESAGLLGLNPSGKVYKLDNSLGGKELYAYSLGGCSSASIGYTWSTYYRNIIGFVKCTDDAITFTNQLPSSTSWAFNKKENQIAPLNSKLTYTTPAGGVSYFFANQLEEQPYCTSHMPTVGTSQARAATVFSIPTGMDIKTNKCTNYNVIPDEIYGSELVANGTFEGTFTNGLASGFTLVRGNVSQDTVTPYSGTSAQKITNPDGNSGQLYQNISSTTNKIYKLSFWAKAHKGSGGILADNSGNNSFSTISISNSDYTYYSTTFVAKGNSVIIACYAFSNATSDTNGITIDNVSLKEVTYSLGNELITTQADREFTSDTTWWTRSNTSEVTISGGTANFVSTTANRWLQRPALLTIGKVYLVAYTVTAVSGNGVKLDIGGTSPTRTSTGTYVETVTATSTVFQFLGIIGTTASIDNVSVKEVQFAIGTKSYYSSSWIQNHTNMTLSGDPAATLTTVDDTQELIKAGIYDITGPKVYKLDNSGGTGTAFVNISATATNTTNTHSIKVYARKQSNSNNGVLAMSGFGGDTGITNDTYTIVKIENFLPTSTSNVPVIYATTGRTVYFILNQLEQASTCNPDPIITYGAAGYRSYGGKNIKNNDFTISLDAKLNSINAYQGLLGSGDATSLINITGDSSNWLSSTKYARQKGYTTDANYQMIANNITKILLKESSSDGHMIFSRGIKGFVSSNKENIIFKSSLLLGANYNGGQIMNGTLKNLRIYKKPLSDSKCISITK